jgi:hypothetical protein
MIEPVHETLGSIFYAVVGKTDNCIFLIRNASGVVFANADASSRLSRDQQRTEPRKVRRKGR